ncbi:MAG: dihydroorotase [Pseudomonadales bacterium]|nr:dihydroorotase [Pseudomonadales bacterium]MDP6471082.1 dihydroorotase [Pseudomonadales bacterium]MDP6825732.1 dihydroorotase [Pseudomonadales bacterium]MDP6970703.1 dihydroorotase [Pseudomonadales bacterium]
MSSVRIVNARLVNEGTIVEGDLLVRDGRIAAVGTVPAGSTPEYDAAGAYLLPGMIDDQVHFREPGFEHKGTIATESRAAIAGGITSYMEMPNCNPLTINQAALDDKRARASKASQANFAFYLGATNDNLEEIKSVDPTSTCGIKVFMGASTGNMLVDNEETLDGIFASTPLVIATHCEDTPTILANEAAARRQYGEDIPFTEHPNIRSAEACYASSSLAVELARRHRARLHVLHLTTAREMALFTAGPLQDKRITAEACVHHLYFDADWYADKGADIKCNPAIKLPQDRAALISAVTEDRIDVIATDHAPHTKEEKAGPYGQVPAGLPLVQHALISLFEQPRFDAATIARKTAHAPAELFAVADRGYLREGYHADLVLIDDQGIDGGADVLSKCGWSPFAGVRFTHRVRATWVNGHLRYGDGQLIDGPMGEALTFHRA